MCVHNDRWRYDTGFYCNDCETFFSKDSPTYRKSEYLSTLWMVLHNINVDIFRSGKGKSKVVTNMKNEIGIGKNHKNYEDIISRAETIIKLYKSTPESANIILKGDKIMNKIIVVDTLVGNVKTILPKPEYVGQKLTIINNGNGLVILDDKFLPVHDITNGIMITAIDKRKSVNDKPDLSFISEQFKEEINKFNEKLGEVKV